MGLYGQNEEWLDGRVSRLEDKLKNAGGGAPGQGPKGDKGNPGKDGAPGTTGPQGPKGDPGHNGTQGIQGVAGPKGDAGTAGVAGATGPAGAVGAAGPKGDKGDAGKDGTQGIPSNTTTITNINDITDTGHYDGTDVVGAPVKGKTLISAIKDTSGDIQYNVYSIDGHLRLGGKPSGGTIQWDPVIPLVFKGAKAPSKTIGIDGDNYIQTGTVQTAADVVKPTFKAGEKHNTLDLSVPANVVSVAFGMLNKIVVVPVHGQAGKFDLHLYANMGGKNPIHGAPAKQPFQPMIMFINNIEFALSDMNMASMPKGYITIDHKHPQAELIATSLEVANTGNVTIQYANHGAITFEKIAGAWFKGITVPDVMGMVNLVMPIINMNLASMSPVYNPKAMAYAKGALVAEGGKFYVANKKMGKMGAEIGAFKPADWDEFDKHFKYAPTMPTTDGKYELDITKGVSTWVKGGSVGSTFTAPKVLSPATDLDTFKTEGYYENKSKTDLGTIALHYPEDGSLGILKVFADTNLSTKVYQEFMDIKDARFYTRAFDGTVWGQWVQRDLSALKPNDVATVADIDAPKPTAEQLGKIMNLYGTKHLTEKMIREFRTTVIGTVKLWTSITRAECIATFKQIPHFDFTKDDDFYVEDTKRSNLVLIKYRANGATDEASAGAFWIEKLTEAV